MEAKISLAWAIEVDSAQLGARLEAYIETKAAVTTLVACLSRYRLPPKAHIPERTIPREIIDLIADAVKDADYEPRVRAWTKSRRCAQNKCETLDHLTQADINGIIRSYVDPRNYNPARLFADSCPKHWAIKTPFLEKITETRPGRFAWIKRVCFLISRHILGIFLHQIQGANSAEMFNDRSSCRNFVSVHFIPYWELPT